MGGEVRKFILALILLTGPVLLGIGIAQVITTPGGIIHYHLPPNTQELITAQLLQPVTIGLDLSGQDHYLAATSGGSGLSYTAAPSTPFEPYENGQWWVVHLDTPQQPGATLNIGGLGPGTIVGTCNQICIMLPLLEGSSNNPPALEFLVH